MMYCSGKGSPHSHGTPLDVVPTIAGIPSTLNPLPRYYCEFQSHSCGYHGNTANAATMSLFSTEDGRLTQFLSDSCDLFLDICFISFRRFSRTRVEWENASE